MIILNPYLPEQLGDLAEDARRTRRKLAESANPDSGAFTLEYDIDRVRIAEIKLGMARNIDEIYQDALAAEIDPADIEYRILDQLLDLLRSYTLGSDSDAHKIASDYAESIRNTLYLQRRRRQLGHQI